MDALPFNMRKCGMAAKTYICCFFLNCIGTQYRKSQKYYTGEGKDNQYGYVQIGFVDTP